MSAIKKKTDAVLTFEGVKPWDAVPVRINKLHHLAQQSAATAIEFAVAAGELLIEEKKSVGHGGWLSWLQENVEFSERTARNYMRVAREFPKLESENRQRVADLSFRDLLRTLTTDTNKISRLPTEALEDALETAESQPLRQSINLTTTAERVRQQQRQPTEKWEPPADSTPAFTFKMPAWRIELRDRVLEIVRETMAQKPELTVADVIESLNDAYCELQDRDAPIEANA